MSIELLDCDDAAALAEYERAFYAAFERVPDNRLVRSLWQWDDKARRVATRVPYADQLIYLTRLHGAIDGALAVNLRLAQFQSAAYGFARPVEPAGVCELLSFFAVADRRMATRAGFWRACIADLEARGFHTAYATSAPSSFATYVRFGATLVDEAELAGEPRYFLSFATGGREGCARSGPPLRPARAAAGAAGSRAPAPA
jgi:hypothetical protein